MVSRFSSVFRAFVATEEPSSRRGTRKRALESEPHDVDVDVLESPLVKRARSSDSESSSRSTISSPSEALSKFASWIKVKSTSFAESYFSRPAEDKHSGLRGPPHSGNQESGNALNRRPLHGQDQGTPFFNMSSTRRKTHQDQRSNHPQHTNTNKSNHGGNHQQHQQRQPHNQHQQRISHQMQQQRGGRYSSGLPPGAKPRTATSSQDVILVNGNGHGEDEADDVQVVENSYEFRVPKNVGRNKATHRQQGAGVPQAFNRSHVPRATQTVNISKPINKTINHPPHISRSYQPVVDKVFPRRTVSPRTRINSSRSGTTAGECVRLSEKQRYQDLLQQFTSNTRYKIPASSSVFSSQLSSSIHEPPPRMEQRHPPPQQLTTDIGSLVRKPIVRHQEPSILGNRILPHQYNSKKEIREAARLRLHVPVTELSPKATPIAGDRRHMVSTPAQPDFSCDSRPESPVITAIKPSSPRSESRGVSPITVFERSLRDSPYALEDWVKNMKDQFDSSTRIRNRQAEEQEVRVKLHEERRLREQSKLIDRIREQMTIAEKTEAVIDDPVFILESEDEDEIEELEEEEELPELTPEMEDEIDAALVPHPPNETLLEGFKLLITRHDIQTLHGLNWLNDEVINFYMQLIMARSQEDGFPNVHCFNTFFYPKLLKGGQQSLRRWTKRVDIFAKDFVVVPVHLGMHWCMAIVDFRIKSIVYYDSMGSNNRKCLEALRDYLRAEHQDKKGSPYDLSAWSLTSAKDIPQQLNGSDCGMFACKFAEYITRDAIITFSQHDMPYFRRRMIWEILHMKLL